MEQVEVRGSSVHEFIREIGLSVTRIISWKWSAQAFKH